MIKKFRGKTPIIPKSCYISESVDIIGDVTLGQEINIWFGTVIRGDMNYVKIGNRTNIQDNSTVHVTTNIAPTIIGSGVTIGHNAIIHGCTIGDNCLIGMGSIIMDEAIIGEGSLIGAGAVVTPNMIIPPKSLVVGLPAKIVRLVNEAETKEILDRSQHYIDFANEYKNT
jgi:carbonic anhydrase/acetyltransferase-like protein (isoleucine patch superfamily)